MCKHPGSAFETTVGGCREMMVRASGRLSNPKAPLPRAEVHWPKTSPVTLAWLAILEAGSPVNRVREPSPALERLGEGTELIWPGSWTATVTPAPDSSSRPLSLQAPTPRPPCPRPSSSLLQADCQAPVPPPLPLGSCQICLAFSPPGD